MPDGRYLGNLLLHGTNGASADLTEALMGLARETKARGWWHACGDVIPEGFDVCLGLEEAASQLQLSWYEQKLIPGILQAAAYARTLIEAGQPRSRR
jgi:hypothetical protein